MDGKRLLAFGLVMVTVLAFVQPVDALLWPPVIGTCGLGGLFGPFGWGFPFGFGFGCPVPVPVPVPVAAPVPAAIPGPLCAPGFGFGGCDLGLPGPGLGGWGAPGLGLGGCGFGNSPFIPGPA